MSTQIIDNSNPGTFSFIMPLLPKARVGQKSGVVATSIQGVIKACRNGESGMWVEARPSFMTDVSTQRTIWFDEWVTKFVEGEGFAEGVRLMRMQDKVIGYHLKPEAGEHPEWVVASDDDALIDIQLKGDLPLSGCYQLDGVPVDVDEYSLNSEGPYNGLDLEELISHEPGKRRPINQVELTVQMHSFYVKEYKDQQTLMLSVDVVGVNLLTERLADFSGEDIQSYLNACTEVVKPTGTGRKKAGLKLIQRQSTTTPPTTITTPPSPPEDIDIQSMI